MTTTWLPADFVHPTLDELVPRWIAEAWPLTSPRYVGRDLSWAEWMACRTCPGDRSGDRSGDRGGELIAVSTCGYISGPSKRVLSASTGRNRRLDA